MRRPCPCPPQGSARGPRRDAGQESWGYPKLAAYTRHESIDEMRHAEMLTDRVLFLEGLPNFQRVGTLSIGTTVPEQLRSDMATEVEAVDRLRRGIAHMRDVGDVTSARLFEDILADEEHHVDYLGTQLELVDTLGEALYLSRLVEQPGTG